MKTLLDVPGGQMKYVTRLVILVCIFASGNVLAETKVLKKKKAKTATHSELRAFKNFGTRMAALENYSVTYIEPSKKAIVIKEVRIKRTTENVDLQLVAKKAKPAEKVASR